LEGAKGIGNENEMRAIALSKNVVYARPKSRMLRTAKNVVIDLDLILLDRTHIVVSTKFFVDIF
jgi:hypothetical protein